MICIIAMIVAIVIAVISIIVVYNEYDNFIPLMVIAIVLALCLGFFNTLMRVNYIDIHENLHAEYEEIVLLLDSVDQSDNEYLRHIFFERVQEYNRQYDLYVQDLNSPWFNWLVYDNVDDIEHIEFNWRGVPND